MKIHLLTLALVAASAAAPAIAQDTQARPTRAAATSTRTAADTARYPQATRRAPAPKVSREGAKALDDAMKAFAAQNYAGTLSQALAFAPKATSPYETAVAYQLAGSAAFQTKDYPNAAAYFQKAIDANGLDNNGHYDAMGNRVAALANAGQHAEAMRAIDAFLAESRSTDPQWADLRNQLMARTGNASQAAAVYEQALAKNPNDRAAFTNLLAIRQQSGNEAEALKLLRDGYARGLLATPELMDQYYATLLQKPQDNWQEAEKVLDEGIARGIIARNQRTAAAYEAAAKGAFDATQWNRALAIFAKAAAISSNGNADLQRARILNTQGKKAESRAAAQEALRKGGLRDIATAQSLAK